jgi:hypothetical protein
VPHTSAGLENITAEDRAGVLMALEAFDKGLLDSAAALYLARSSRAACFITLGQPLAK